jgi:TonB family protein
VREVLHATLIEETSVVAMPAVPLSEVFASVAPRTLREHSGPKETAGPPDRAISPPAKRSASRPAALAAPRDPTWYSARELDELPRPLRPIRPPHMPAARGGGRVLLQLAIDESGAVTDARIVDADWQGDLAARVLAAGREARFRPGMKGGRIVKSKLLVELTFEPKG